MHYPLAMLLLALVDQRACNELEEPAKQNGLRQGGHKAGSDAEMERIGQGGGVEKWSGERVTGVRAF